MRWHAGRKNGSEKDVNIEVLAPPYYPDRLMSLPLVVEKGCFDFWSGIPSSNNILI
jgi:hypothetical protein